MKYFFPFISLVIVFSIGVYANEPKSADTAIIRSHLTKLTKTKQFRNHRNVEQLDKTADYIRSVFEQYSDSVRSQPFSVNGNTYQNVICSFGTQHDKRIVIGAHYDVCGKQEGADDNASGITGLLELARLLKGEKLGYRIDLVAYTLEEPPYFRTESMGSYQHAAWLNNNNVDVYGMISIEMIGYFRDDKKSQSYPLGLLSLFYGNKGNYITLVKKWGSGTFARKFSRRYKSAGFIRTKKFSGPKALTGIDFSDHLNYWKFGYSALMITDTSFYRNRNYHESTDTLNTLNLKRMAKVIGGIFITLKQL